MFSLADSGPSGLPTTHILVVSKFRRELLDLRFFARNTTILFAVTFQAILPFRHLRQEKIIRQDGSLQPARPLQRYQPGH